MARSASGRAELRRLIARLLIAAGMAAALVVPALAQPMLRIDQRAVWRGGDLSACRASAGEAGLRICLATAMRRAGASPQAIAFTRSFPGGAYISRFTPFGPIGLAVATSPFMANSNDAFLLTGGRPPIVDVAAEANDRALARFPAYRAFLRRRPGQTLWPRLARFLGPGPATGGGRSFLFAAPFRQCHACANAATAQLAYDFDAALRFQGVRLVAISPGPR